MTCAPKKCGLIKTEFEIDTDDEVPDPKLPGAMMYNPSYGVTATSGALAGRRVHFQDVLDKANEALAKAVQSENGIVPDPDMPPCGEGCECGGVVWTPRPADYATVTATFSNNGIKYQAKCVARRTISDGVGRCRTAPDPGYSGDF
jgi:hypothetical protein